MKTGISDPNDTLVVVEVFTKHGDHHKFPAMGRRALEVVVPKGSNRTPAGTPTLALVNASLAVLSIPFNTIKSIKVDGEAWWDFRA